MCAISYLKHSRLGCNGDSMIEEIAVVFTDRN